jgi:hypothetical protein
VFIDLSSATSRNKQEKKEENLSTFGIYQHLKNEGFGRFLFAVSRLFGLFF